MCVGKCIHLTKVVIKDPVYSFCRCNPKEPGLPSSTNDAHTGKDRLSESHWASFINILRIVIILFISSELFAPAFISMVTLLNLTWFTRKRHTISLRKGHDLLRMCARKVGMSKRSTDYVIMVCFFKCDRVTLFLMCSHWNLSGWRFLDIKNSPVFSLMSHAEMFIVLLFT